MTDPKSVFSPSEEKLLTALVSSEIKFLIVGQTAAILQGAITTTQDVDIWIKDLGSDIFQDVVRSVGAVYIPLAVAGMNPPMLAPSEFGTVDLVTGMSGLDDFDEEYKNAVSMDVSGLNLMLLPLERVIVSKKAANRDKDKATLPALEATLAAHKKLKE